MPSHNGMQLLQLSTVSPCLFTFGSVTSAHTLRRMNLRTNLAGWTRDLPLLPELATYSYPLLPFLNQSFQPQEHLHSQRGILAAHFLLKPLGGERVVSSF